MPVTAFIKQFFEPFDDRFIARKLSKFSVNRQLKKGVKYWLAEWKKNRDEGTEIHKLMEDFIVSGKTSNKYAKASLAMHWFRNKMRSLSEPVADAEFQLFDAELGLAGTIDCIIQENDAEAGRHVILIDWKTNKEIKKKSYNKLKCKEPLQHLEDCNYNNYALQLSLYAYIFERQNHKVYKLVLVHLTDDKVFEMEVPYMKKEIEEMIKYDNDRKRKENVSSKK
jgi:hypothetical protein